MSELKQHFCNNCNELWPTTYDCCLQCKKDPVKFSKINDMIPGISDLEQDIKKEFEELTMIEEMLISPILAIMSVYRLPSGALTSRGFCANFTQNIQPFVKLLPRLPQDLPILVLKKKDQQNNFKYFKVKRQRVQRCLQYLCENNPQFIEYGIQLSYENLIILPVDSTVSLNEKVVNNIDENHEYDIGPEIRETVDEETSFEIESSDCHVYVESDFIEPLQDDMIKNAINFPDANANSLNEYETHAICSLLFPKLFPNGRGDPTNKVRRIDVTESLGFKHLLKTAAVNSNGEFYYPWAQHQRFKFWAYDRLRRHRSLEQCKVYLKQNPGDGNLTINELKNLVTSGECQNILKRMTAYSSNITGSNSYWFKRRGELEGTFEQMRPASVFFTFSYPDNHWEDLHQLIPGPAPKTPSEKRQRVLNNPHLVDWFFGYKLNEFLKAVFDDILDCEWRWHRYEWQSRSAIHAHGAVRFKNDPGLIKLTTEAYKGRLALKELKEISKSASKSNQDEKRRYLQEIIKKRSRI
jgi:hypothetical protein